MNDLTGMTPEELRDFSTGLGEKSFRGGQIFSWIHQHGSESFAEMTTLSKELRRKLESKATLQIPEVIDVTESGETASRKFLFRLTDGMKIESVFLPEGKRRTVCLSSQVGCPLDCKFCATAKMGLFRNLTTGEIVGHLLAVGREIGERITNVVFMGMGEPMLNYDNVIKAATIIHHPEGLNIGSRKITISTVGMADSIRQYADEGHPFKLALSLNAADDALRDRLMPINRKHNLEACISALDHYSERTGKRFTIEYVLMAGTNDRPEDATRLAGILKRLDCKLNLIPYNPIPGESFKRPNRDQLKRFYELIYGAKRTVTVRWSQGKDINAACGQLHAENQRKNVRKVKPKSIGSP